MATTTTIPDEDQTQLPARRQLLHWQTLLALAAGLVLLGVAVWLRLHDLGLPFDRDSYDEGVYWETLRSMHAGYSLYGQTFYSQPPFFLLSVYPFFALLGQNLWAARLGIAVLSLSGYIGAFLLGKKLAGNIGAIVAMLLLLVDPLYLTQSQRLQAEAPSAGFSFLAIGLIFYWWEQPESRTGLCWLALSAVAVVCSIMGKLLGVATLVPMGLILLMYGLSVYRREKKISAAWKALLWPLIVFIGAFVVTMLVLILPFAGSLPQLWAGVVSFHSAASKLTNFSSTQNIDSMHGLLTSIMAIGALCGVVLALLKRDWRVVPLLAWFLTTFVLLLLQVPLFHHHLVSLIPPMISLAIIGLAGLRLSVRRVPAWREVIPLVSAVVIVFVLALNAQAMRDYYRNDRAASIAGKNSQLGKIASDVRSQIGPDDFIITDAQFIAAMAGRNTPPSLVDTSLVRIDTRYITAEQVIQEAQQPQVKAILIWSGRLSTPAMAPFQQWMKQHFRIVKDYGSGRRLWLKI